MAVPNSDQLQKRFALFGYNETDNKFYALSVESDGSLSVSNEAASGIGNGQKTVTSAGTAEVLGTSTAILSITVKALRTNTGDIYVGDSGVTSSNGHVLERGASVSLDIDNLSDIYIDSDNNGEGVSFLYLTE